MNDHATEAVVRAAGGVAMMLLGAMLVLSAPVVLARALLHPARSRSEEPNPPSL